MTSAAPARKPYRKAPPQHRETRHNQPVFLDDLSGSPSATSEHPAHPESTQVICLGKYSPIFQRRFFTDPYPECHESLMDPGAYSSSWSESKQDVSSFSSLDLVLSPPEIFSNTLGMGNEQQKGMNRFLSDSEDLLVQFSDEDDEPTWKGSQQLICSSKSAERTLAFKEQIEILAPKVEKRLTLPLPSHAPPPKGILKLPHQLEVHPCDSLRKSKSAEMLAPCHSNAQSKKPKCKSLDRERQEVQLFPEPTGSDSSILQSSVPEWKAQLLEEKLKFSKFLDEITYSVLSPGHLKMLGCKTPETSEGNQGQWQNEPNADLKNQTSAKADLKNYSDQKQEKNQPWEICTTQQDRNVFRRKESRPKYLHTAVKKDDLKQEQEKLLMEPNKEQPQLISESSDYGRAGGSVDSRQSGGIEYDCLYKQRTQNQTSLTCLKDSGSLTKFRIQTSQTETLNLPTSQTTHMILAPIKVSAPGFLPFTTFQLLFVIVGFSYNL